MMKQSQELKVKIQTMSRSEYVEAKHLPNALPAGFIKNHQESPAVPITRKLDLQRPERPIEEDNFEIISNVKHEPEEKKPEPKREEKPAYIPRRREEKAVRSGREDAPDREEPPKQEEPKQEPPKQYRYEPRQYNQEPPKQYQPPIREQLREEPKKYEPPARDDGELRRLRAENDDLRRKLNDCLQGKGDCDNKCKKLKEEKDQLEKKCKDLADLAAKADAKNPIIQALQDEVYNIGKKLNDANLANKQLKDENDALKKQIKEMPPPADPEEKLRFLGNLVLLASEIERLHTVIRSLLQEKDEADQEIDRLTDLLVQKDLRIVMLSAELDRVTKLVDHLLPLEEINSNLNNQVNELTDELQKLKEKLDSPDLLELLQRSYNAMVTAMQPLQGRVMEQRMVQTNQCCELHEKIRDMRHHILTYEERTINFMVEMERMQKLIEQLGAELPPRTTLKPGYVKK